MVMHGPWEEARLDICPATQMVLYCVAHGRDVQLGLSSLHPYTKRTRSAYEWQVNSGSFPNFSISAERSGCPMVGTHVSVGGSGG